jgi:hypothetical protein
MTTQVMGSNNDTAPSTTMRSSSSSSSSPSSKQRQRNRRRRNDRHAVLVEEDGMEYHQAALILEHYQRHARSLDIILEQEDDILSRQDTDFHHYNVLLHQRYRKASSLKRSKTFSSLTDLDNETGNCTTLPPPNERHTHQTLSKATSTH